MNIIPYVNRPAPLAWDVAKAIFGSTGVGAWYDPSDLSTVFQDITGTIPGAAGAPIALLLDKHLGGELGPELYTGQNANSISNAAGGAVYTWDDSTRTLAITSAGSNASYPRIIYAPGITAGKFYKIYGRIVSDGVDLNLVRLALSGSSYNIPYDPTTGVFEAQMASGSNRIQFNVDGRSTGTIRIAELSIREIPGLHASQATTSACPTLVQSGDNYYLQYDGVDDKLTLTLASAFTGYLFIAGTNGSILEPVSFSAGAVDLGPLTYTGGTPGIFNAIGGIVGVVLIDRELTEGEQTVLVEYYKARGAKGLLVEGPELVTNGDFSSGSTGWTLQTGVAVVDGEVVFDGETSFAANATMLAPTTSIGISAGKVYLTRATVTSTTTRRISMALGGTSSVPFGPNATGPFSDVVIPAGSGNLAIAARFDIGARTGGIDDISVKELRAEEDWS